MTAREVLDGIKDRLAKAHGECQDCGKCRTVPDSDWCVACQDWSCERGTDCADVGTDVARLTRAIEDVLKYAHRLDQDGHAMTCADDAVKRTVGTHLRREARKIHKAIEDALNPKEGQ